MSGDSILGAPTISPAKIDAILASYDVPLLKPVDASRSMVAAP